MWLYDFHIFYQAGQAVWAGTSPYLIYDFNPPYFMALVFAPLALLPEPVAYGLYHIGSISLVWRVMGRRSVWAVLAFPVWFSLFVGQVDLPLTLLILLGGPWTWPLALIKPQLGLVVLPWLVRRANGPMLLQAIGLGFGFIALAFIVRPTWFGEWLAIIPSLTQYARRDSNLYWLIPAVFKTPSLWVGVPIGLGLGLYLRHRRDSWMALHLLAPLTNIYSVSVLAEWLGPIEVGLSWLVIFGLGGDVHHGGPFFVIAVSIWIRHWLMTSNFHFGRINLKR